MKKILAIFVMVLFAAYPAVSQASSGHGEPVAVSGVIVLQHIISSDHYENEGDDNTDAYKIYLNFDKQVTEGIKTHVTINADEFGSNNNDDTGARVDSKALEEAQIIFTDVAGQDITIVTGKQEAPFGQDYSQFITSTHTHHYEIDKVWGIGVVFGIDGFGSVTAAVANSASSEDEDIKLTETTALKVKADKLMEGLSVEVSTAKVGKDKATSTSVDETRTSIGAKYSIADATIAVESTTFDDKGNSETDDDESATLIGVDYKIGNILLKANIEDVTHDATHHIDTVNAYGANYEFADGVYATVESQTIKHESGHGDDASQILLGLYAHF